MIGDIKSKDALNAIVEYRFKNKDRVTLANLNINSIRNKFSSPLELVSSNIDVLVIEETKLDKTFPQGCFDIPGYKRPLRRDRDIHGGGIMFFIREDIPSRKLDMFKFSIDIEGLFIEINLGKSKWLLLATYKLPSFSKHDYFNHVGKALDFYVAKYENVIIMGDLDTIDSEKVLLDFLKERELSNLVKFPTCFKSDTNPSVIDFIITNK